MPLVIVESPAKCGKIKSFLGADYDVVASMGHIRALEENLDAVGIDRDFEPRFEFMKEKSKAISQIKDAAKNHKVIILAADDDREGEAIAYSIALLLKLNPETTQRAVFHEITSNAVTYAIENPRTIDMNKVYAQQSRAVLDMLVGFTISRCLWNHVGHALSAGRCQTPALRLVADKETDIASFKSSMSWKIRGNWLSNTNTLYEANLTDELEDEESATNYIEMRANKYNGKILEINTRKNTENPPLPLITSSLQQQASNLLRTNPKNTMKIAQRLYEAGHITYMRTDKAVLGEEATIEGNKYILKTFGEKYLNVKPTQVKEPKNKSKKLKTPNEETQQTPQKPQSQEAHEAIRPTHMDIEVLPHDEDWSMADRKLYKLIWTRALQSLMAPCTGESRSIDFRAEDDDDDWTWRSTFSRTTFDGWKRLNTNELKEELNDAKESFWLESNSLKVGQLLKWTQLVGEPHFTKAPARYTEASLIKELETNGIGRPSTFASLISTILDKNYVEKKDFEAREVNVNVLTMNPNESSPTVTSKLQKLGAEKDRLVPTPLGLSVIEYLLKNFQTLFDYTFTASMEQRLDNIANGTQPWKDVVKDTWNSYKTIYATQCVSKTINDAGNDRKKEFGDNILAVITKKGPLLLKEDPSKDKTKTVFYGWPSGVSFQNMTLEMAKKFIEDSTKSCEVVGIYEEKEILRKKGPYGFYVEWNGKKVSCTESSTYDEIVKKLQEPSSSSILKVIGDFEFRKGPYGNYMVKQSAVKKQFVSVPDKINLDELTIVNCIAMFQNGLQQKAKFKNNAYTKANKPPSTNTDTTTGNQGSRGGFRGGGRGRGGKK